MRADVIIFDKDGTLMDFDAYWVTVSAKSVARVLRDIGREDIPVSEILWAFGVRDGVTAPDSVLCKGTYEEMGRAMSDVLEKYGASLPLSVIIEKMLNAYERCSHEGRVRPTCENLYGVLSGFKRQGKKLMVVTTDKEDSTHRCLRLLGVETLFDQIYSDDGQAPTKPDPFLLEKIRRETGVSRERMIMVGDTLTDMAFARNGGIFSVGVAKTAENAAALRPFADFVIPDVSHLPEILA